MSLCAPRGVPTSSGRRTLPYKRPVAAGTPAGRKGQPISAEADRPVSSWRRRGRRLGLPVWGSPWASVGSRRPVHGCTAEGGRQGWAASCAAAGSAVPAGALASACPCPPPHPRAPLLDPNQPAKPHSFPKCRDRGTSAPQKTPLPYLKGKGALALAEQERGGYRARGWMAGCIYLAPPTPATPCRWDPPLSSSWTWISPGHTLHPLT